MKDIQPESRIHLVRPRAWRLGSVLLLASLSCQPRTSSPPTPTSTALTGAACQKNDDCASSVCLPLANSTNVCTASCGTPSDCVPGWDCRPFPSLPNNICQCTPTLESCDGLDNDCNGQADDGLQPAAQCRAEHSASTAWTCRMGACDCVLSCGGECVDPLIDEDHCGGCDQACPVGGSCVNGGCECPTGMTNCEGTCVDAQTNTDHCGACRHACTDEAPQCISASCLCPAPNIVCDGTCVDPLTDNLHCGGCGLACPGGCNAGVCRTRIIQHSQSGTPTAFVIDSTTLYWASTGGVYKVPLVGDARSTLLNFSTGGGRPFLVQSGDNLLTTDAVRGTVVRVPKAGGAAVTLASGQTATAALAVNSSTVFWLNWQAGKVMQMPIDGGAVVTLTSDQNVPIDLAADESFAYWVTEGHEAPTGTVVRAPVGGGALVTLASGLSDNSTIALDSEYIYWGMSQNGVRRMLKTGGSVETIGSQGANALAMDGEHIYWVSFTNNSVFKAPLAGGSVATVLKANDQVTQLAVDDAFLYWRTGIDFWKGTPR